MKRMIAIALCIGMTAFLAACSGGGSSSQGSGATSGGGGTSSSSIAAIGRDAGDKREVHSYDEAVAYLKEIVKPEERYAAGAKVSYADRGTEEINDSFSYMVSFGEEKDGSFVPEHHFAVSSTGDIYEVNTSDGSFTQIF